MSLDKIFFSFFFLSPGVLSLCYHHFFSFSFLVLLLFSVFVIRFICFFLLASLFVFHSVFRLLSVFLYLFLSLCVCGVSCICISMFRVFFLFFFFTFFVLISSIHHETSHLWGSLMFKCRTTWEMWGEMGYAAMVREGGLGGRQMQQSMLEVDRFPCALFNH